MRISIVGNSGSGKTTLARRVAARTGVHRIELDAHHHLPDWTQIDRETMRANVRSELDSHDRWVCDGNYNGYVGDIVRMAADTIVLISLPRSVVMSRIIRRTIRRAVTREELWNGNREPLTNFTSWDPAKNIIRWSWTNHDRYRDQYLAEFDSGRWPQAETVVLRSSDEVDAWVDTLPSAPAH